MLYFLAYSGLISGIAALVFGSFVYLKNRHNVINRSYGLLSLSLVLWGIPYFFWPLAKTKEQALLSFQLLHVGAVLVAPAYLWFIFALLNIHKKFRKLIFASSIVAAFLIPFVPTRFFIKDMVPQYIFRYWAIPGIMYHLFLLSWFSCVFFVWLHLGIHYHRSSGSRKNQLKYVLIGTVLGILGGATNYLPWYKIYIPPVGTILVAVHVAIFAYAIVKYRLMDISVTITRAGIFLAVYTLVLGLPFLFAIHGKTLLIQKLGSYWWLGPLVLMAGLGATGPFVYLFLKNKAEGILLREQRAYQTALKNAAVDLTRIRNPQKIFDFIAQTITESVKISFTAIYFLDAKTGKFNLKSLVPARNGHPENIEDIDPLIPALMAKQEAIVLEETKQEADMDKNPATTAIIERMEKLYASVIVPCFLENRLLNIMILGEKTSGKSYTQEDIDNFSILAAEVSLATENALLYEKIEDEVKRKTEELVTVQKELVHAEKLATVGTLAGGVAHEINNPLTAILTNVQMLLSDNEPDRESLEMIEEATKRCKTIVQKLMTFSQKPMANTMMYEVNIIDIIQHTVNFLKFQLEQENITLEIKADKDSYSVLANHDELGQVLTNIILNAKDAIQQVKKSGSVYISVSENKTQVLLRIKDEGIGIPKEILNRIFDPFYTTKEVGKGLGLGLSICQTIIEKHKGKILVESEVNVGSTFTIQLPKIKH